MKFCDYRCKKYTAPRKILHRPSVKITSPPEKNLHHPSVKITPHNITDKIEDTIADTDRETDQSPVLSAANGIASIFCTAFGVETISKAC